MLTEDIVRDRPCHAGDCCASRLTSPSVPSSVTASPGRSVHRVAHVDGRQVHRNRSQNRRKFAGRDHLAAVREPVKHTIRIARAQNRDAHGARRAKRAAVAHQRVPSGISFTARIFAFQVSAGCTFRMRLGRRPPRAGETITVEGVAGAHHVVPRLAVRA